MKPIPQLLIIADRGQMAVYKVRKSPPGLTQLERTFIEEGLSKLSDTVTDKAGHFPNQAIGGKSANSSAERMTLVAEYEMRAFRKIGDKINTLLKSNGNGKFSWGFAAPSEINGAIMDQLDAKCKKTLTHNLSLDLVNLPQNEIIKRFEG